MRRIARQFNLTLACAFLLLAFPAASFAGGATCSSAAGLTPDGRIRDLDYVQPGGTAWYSFSATSGHSYSIEAKDDLDGAPATQELIVTFFSSACSTQMTAGQPPYGPTLYRDTSGIEPKVIANTGMRISVPNPSDDTISIKVVNNNSSSGHYVSISVSETTMFSPAWLDTGSFNTFYAFQNTTSSNINGTFSFWDTASGTLVAPSPVPLTLSPKGTSMNTFSLNLTREKGGSAFLTHDGPPGALIVDAIIANFSSNYEQPTKLVPLRESAH